MFTETTKARVVKQIPYPALCDFSVSILAYFCSLDLIAQQAVEHFSSQQSRILVAVLSSSIPRIA